MAGANDPRTKMINLMYLVLMALLALNVSSEVMNAFKIINESFDKSNFSLVKKNSILLKQFDKELKAQGEKKVGPFLEKATNVNQICDNAIAHLSKLKKDLIKESNPDENGKYKEDDLDAATRLMIVKKEGPKLEKMLKNVRSQLLSYVDEKDIEKLSLSFPLKVEMPKVLTSKENNDWTSAHFRMMPTLGVLTIFNKFQNDVINSQATILEYLLKKINAEDIKFDRFEPLVSANSQYLLVGDKFEAEIGVGAFSSTADPTILVDGKPLVVKNGKATFSENANFPGTVSHKVEVLMKGPDGKNISYPKKLEYRVGIPSGIVVTADKVNVLYRGIPNPITVTTSSSGSEQIKIKVSNGIFKGKHGKYLVIPGKEPVTKINVYVKRKLQGISSFRTKDIPPPTLMVGNSSGGRISASIFKAEGGVRAVLKDFLFEGIRFKVMSYVISCSGAGFPDGIQLAKNRGPRWVGRAKALILKSRPGSVVQVDEVRIKGPDGKVTKLPPIAFTLK